MACKSRRMIIKVSIIFIHIIIITCQQTGRLRYRIIILPKDGSCHQERKSKSIRISFSVLFKTQSNRMKVKVKNIRST